MSPPIINAAQAIIPHLPELLGEHAESVTNQLQILFVKHKNGEHVESEIIDLLGEYEAAGAWMNKKLHGGQETTKGETLVFSDLGGDPELDKIKGLKYYKCSNDKCDYRWTKNLDWQKPLDKCPECSSALIEDD